MVSSGSVKRPSPSLPRSVKRPNTRKKTREIFKQEGTEQSVFPGFYREISIAIQPVSPPIHLFFAQLQTTAYGILGSVKRPDR